MLDEEVAGAVPVEFNATIDALIPETKVETDVTSSSLLPSDEWVSEN